MSHAETYFAETTQIAAEIDKEAIETMAAELVSLRSRGGRLFIIGVGGSAANCGHAVNDFRKLCGIEAYAPTDNVSELTPYLRLGCKPANSPRMTRFWCSL
jgi:D-sedoheptulose 7-phosphate isomerase